MARDWRTTWRIGVCMNADLAEEIITATYLSMHLQAWDVAGERQTTLLEADGLEIALVEQRTDACAREPHLRLEIRDRRTNQVVVRRCCDDLERAVDEYLRLWRSIDLNCKPVH